MSLVLFVALLVHVGAHITLSVALVRARGWQRAALAFVLPPLAPHWGWRAGLRVPVYLWTGTLAIYALGVAVA